MIWSVFEGYRDSDCVRWIILRWHADSIEEAKEGPKDVCGYRVKRTYSTLEVTIPAALINTATEQLEIAGYEVEDERQAA